MPDAILQDQSTAQRGKVLSFPITKVNAEKREVWGFATTECVDQQGEIVDYEGSVRAFDKWTSTFEKMTDGNSLGNIREMHGSKSVGKLIAYEPDPVRRGIWVGAKITKSIEGDDAWQKVQDRILNGFSIGAPKAVRRIEFNGSAKVNRVTDYDLAELSLVDNPACPESFFEEIKIASTFEDGSKPAYAMELLKRFDVDAKPSGDDWAPAPNILQKTVELNPDTFVDASGEVWTRLNGRVAKKEKQMDPKATEAAIEKAGKKIGPQHKPYAAPPGPSATVTPDVTPAPVPHGEGMGKDAVPTSNPALGGDGANDGRNAGNAEQEDQIKAEGPGPAGQGAKAAASGGDDAAEASEENGKAASSGTAFCSLCGGGMKSFGDGKAPYHKRCVDARKNAAASGKTAAVGIVDEAGLSKAVATVFEPVRKMINDGFAALEARMEKIEKSPTPGGPMRTELPPGVSPVEKAAGAVALEGEGLAKALEALLPSIQDPMAKQAIQMQIAKQSITKAQRGVMG